MLLFRGKQELFYGWIPFSKAVFRRKTVAENEISAFHKNRFSVKYKEVMQYTAGQSRARMECHISMPSLLIFDLRVVAGMASNSAAFALLPFVFSSACWMRPTS